MLFSFLAAMITSVGIMTANASPLLPGPHPDAIHYMEAGRSFAATGELLVPMASWNAPDSVVQLSHYPPGYSVLIGSVVRAAGVRPEVSVLWLEALGGGATVGLGFWIASGVAGLAGGLGGAALLALLPAFVKLHMGVWSEPLFLPLVLLTLTLGGRSRRAALALGLLAGVGTLIRYVGVALAGYGALDSLRGEGSPRERLLRAALAVAPSLLVLGVWFSMVDSSGEEVRAFRVYGDLEGTLLLARHIAEGLILPLHMQRRPGMYWAGAALLVVPLLVFLALRGAGGTVAGKLRSLGGSALLLFGVYGVVLVAARLLADPFIPLDDRLLLPGLIPLLLVWGAGTGWLLFAGWTPGGRLGKVAGLATVFWMVAVLRGHSIMVPGYQEHGMFYTNRGWLTSDLVFLVELNRERYPLIYSNDPGMVFFHSGRVARKLPTRYGDPEGFRDHFRENPGMIVVFRSQDPRHMVEGGLGRLLEVAPNYLDEDGAAYLPGVDGRIEINRPARTPPPPE